jgi:hypothetical protein
MRTSYRKLGILFLNICRILLRLGDSDCSILFNSSRNFSHSLSINCTRKKCIYCSRGSFSSGGSLDRSSLISGACEISQAVDSLISYLVISLLLDAVQSRTLFLISTRSPIPQLLTAGMGLKIALLLLETQSKAKWMRSQDKNRSPEETIGPFSMSVLFWLNSLMARGVRKLLSLEDLFPLVTSLSAKQLHINS